VNKEIIKTENCTIKTVFEDTSMNSEKPDLFFKRILNESPL
jgi:hypothetical protein